MNNPTIQIEEEGKSVVITIPNAVMLCFDSDEGLTYAVHEEGEWVTGAYVVSRDPRGAATDIVRALQKPIGFPKYLVTSAEDPTKQAYVPLRDAAARLASLFPWDVEDTVLEADYTVRQITEQELRDINQQADEIDASK